EKPRRHRVAARHDVRGGEDARTDVGVAEVGRGVDRGVAVEGQVAGLRADDELLARGGAACGKATQRRAEGALAALRAVVDGSVEQVRAEGDRLDDRGLVAP